MVTDSESIMGRLNIRLALGSPWDEIDGNPVPRGRSALWVQTPDIDMSAAGLAILGDYLPFGIAQATGRWVPSNSLDNTIRVQRLKPTNWVLCDIRVDGVNNGFGHGSVFLWAQDGTLLATASQSAVLHNPRS
jgi:acyl-CoA thioesterase